MRVRVRVITPSLVSVHTEPSWWERWLFGEQEQDSIALGVPGYAGRTHWHYDSTNQIVTDRRVLSAIRSAVL